MCLAVPARVEHIDGTTALVTAFGCQERVDIQLIPSIEIGDLVLVHVGFALQKVRPDEAAFIVETWNTLLAKEANPHE
ncbi:MAG: HypC/HybG/HupF family hydrogenase formation chaperone [Firmicutes bacterium]|nr:HypC/HybG/HupF family hydrogenase formation chaperone [Bacillota bacterium]